MISHTLSRCLSMCSMMSAVFWAFLSDSFCCMSGSFLIVRRTVVVETLCLAAICLMDRPSTRSAIILFFCRSVSRFCMSPPHFAAAPTPCLRRNLSLHRRPRSADAICLLPFWPLPLEKSIQICCKSFVAPLPKIFLPFWRIFCVFLLTYHRIGGII